MKECTFKTIFHPPGSLKGLCLHFARPTFLALFSRWLFSYSRHYWMRVHHFYRSFSEARPSKPSSRVQSNPIRVHYLSHSLPLKSITYLCILSSSSSKLSCQSNFCVQASPPITLLLWPPLPPPGVHYLFAHSIVLSPEALLPIKLCIQAPLYTQPSPLECITYFCVPPLSRSLLRSSPASWKLRWHLALLSASLAVPTAPGVCGWTRSDEPGTTRRSVSYTSASR